jgi:DNA repair protein RecN (Recombination protein N)
LEELEKNLNILENAELIKSSLYKAHQLLANEENGVLENINNIEKELSQIASFNNDYKSFLERIESVKIELSDLDKNFEIFSDQTEIDEGSLVETKERIDLINQLLTKHQVPAIDDLLEIRTELEQKLSDIGTVEEEIIELKKKEKETFTQLLALAEKNF